MGNKKITLQNVKSFLQGNSRQVLDNFNLLSDLIKEQVEYRAMRCKESCSTECQHCGCSTPGRWFSSISCNGGEKFPDFLEREEWDVFKAEKKKYNKELLRKIIEHREYHNKLAPFPLWDSQDTEMLKEKLNMNKVDYDEEPVECCKFCKNIHIIPDEHGNDTCSKCNNIVNDDMEKFDTIYDYLDEYGDIWGMKYNKDGEETGKHKGEQENIL